ncbi:hypothetical protein ACWGQT_12780 [Streptomyces yangpuensis]
MHPEFDRADVVNWLLAHDKITLPAGAGQASLLVRGERGATGRFRLDAPWLGRADDIEATDRLSGWVADDADADALAALAAGPVGATLTRLTAPGAGPLAVLGDVRVTDRLWSGSGGLRITLEWPARLRGTTAHTGNGGVVATASRRPGPARTACAPATTAAAWTQSCGATNTAARRPQCWTGTRAAACAAHSSGEEA